jgi:hypothetical protein
MSTTRDHSASEMSAAMWLSGRMPPTLPATALELRSTLSDDGVVTLAIREAEVVEPAEDQVVVRVDAAPINPSDLGMMFAGGDADAGLPAGDGILNAVAVPVTEAAVNAQRARLGKAMPVGNEGGGVVVAAGPSPAAQALLGKTVGFLSGNAYAQYRTVHVSQCLAMADGTDPADAARRGP